MLDGSALAVPLHVLVVDPDPAAAAALRAALATLEDGARVAGVPTLAAALAARGSGVRCLVTELRLPDGGGADVIRRLRAGRPGVPVVVHAAGLPPEHVVAAVRGGAADVVGKAPTSAPRLARAVREALGHAVLVACDDDGVSLAADGTPAGDLVGTTRAMRHVRDLVARAARSRVPVLIEGETGTGKELVARAVHDRSPRAAAPFLVQSCAALPETLLDSELSGHRRGAFTGAERERPGLFVEAGDGTVFLDEIGEAPPAVQAKLLRVLQHGEVKAVGSDRPRPVHARIVAATNRRLADEVAAGRFRADLYYRLAVFPIRTPPLRHRTADVPELAERFRRRCEREEGRATGGFAPETLAVLMAHPWPGNVRQLEHEVRRLVLTVPAGARIRPSHLDADVRAVAACAGAGEPLRAVLARVELALIRERLATSPSKSAAARSLGITREALYGKLRRLGVSPADG